MDTKFDLRGEFSTQWLRDDTLWLFLLARINPGAMDAIHPQGPVLSQGAVRVFASQILKTIAKLVHTHELQTEIRLVGERLFDSGKASMRYDVDDWRCGNDRWLLPFHVRGFGGGPGPINPGGPVELNPQPQPPTGEYIKALLHIIGDSINDEVIAEDLTKIGQKF